MLSLAGFIRSEMARRNMSIREFAAFVGVVHGTINGYLKDEAPNPDLSVLAKIARATRTDLCSLVALVYPDVTQATRPHPEAIIFMQRFDELPDYIKQLVAATVISSSKKRKGREKGES